jgi:hypothetical protein
MTRADKAEYDRQYRAKNRDRLRQPKLNYFSRPEVKERKRLYDIERRRILSEQIRAYDRERTKKRQAFNKPLVNHYFAINRAKRRKAFPKWLTAEHKRAIRQFYENCPNSYEVDHIVPLLGTKPGTRQRIVSGLHVPWNPQYLPALSNRRKNCFYAEI